MSTLARGRHLCSNSGAALHESVRAVPRVAFQAGCSLADLASQAGALAHWDVPPLCSGLWRQWGARVVPVEVAAAGGDYRDAFLPRPGRLFRSGVPVPLAALLANLQEHAGSCEAGAAEQAASPAAACGAGGAEELAQRGSGAVGAREGTSAAGGGAGGGGDPAGWVAGGASGAGAARAAGAPSQRLYLAQTDLADALPELGARVPGEPPFREAAGRVYQRSVWLGPAGTRTPLHRDPYHNLLCQAWGGKAVRLHAPEHAAALAPYTQHALRNTSQLDCEDPRLAAVPRWECVLRATEALYIPRRWWHQVTATSASLSVSFWWT